MAAEKASAKKPVQKGQGNEKTGKAKVAKDKKTAS
jgi:hypothetical protein